MPEDKVAVGLGEYFSEEKIYFSCLSCMNIFILAHKLKHYFIVIKCKSIICVGLANVY